MSVFQPNSTFLRVLSPHVRIGATDTISTTPNDPIASDGGLTSSDQSLIAAAEVLSLAGTAVGAYHGFKRNNSVGWAIGWAILGGLFPIIVIPVAFAQGIGKRA